MKLQELLEKATERPWEAVEEDPLSGGTININSVTGVSVASTWPGTLGGDAAGSEGAKANAAFVTHAVNNFEPLTVVLRGMTTAMQAILETIDPLNLELARSIIAKHIKIAEEAIRKAEEVKE